MSCNSNNECLSSTNIVNVLISKNTAGCKNQVDDDEDEFTLGDMTNHISLQ